MGKALEWLGSSGCANIFTTLCGDADSRGHRLWATCPFHGGKSKTAFHYEPALDVFFCHSCGQAGDLIQLYGQVMKISDSLEAFKSFAKRYGPPLDEAGLADWKRKQRRRPLSGPTVKPFTFKPTEPAQPPLMWKERAAIFLSHSMQRLKEQSEIIAWLKERGISWRAALNCGLGWNDQFKSFPATAWGLADPEAKINLSPGLVIPFLDQAGDVIKLKIRVFGEIKAGFPRYWLVRGSTTGLAIYGRNRSDNANVFVCESELDAVMLWGMFPDHVFVASGGSQFKPDQLAHTFLRNVKSLGIIFDNDEAGHKSFEDFWVKAYPQARPWPAPEGKDPGDAYKNGVDIAAWLKYF